MTGWTYCEDGQTLPPKRQTVSVLVRTWSSYQVVHGAFWDSLLPDCANVAPGIGTAWWTVEGKRIKSVVAWYDVPVPSAVEAASLMKQRQKK